MYGFVCMGIVCGWVWMGKCMGCCGWVGMWVGRCMGLYVWVVCGWVGVWVGGWLWMGRGMCVVSDLRNI